MTNPEISGQQPSQASLSGLSDAEAAERLRTEGYNELPRTGQRTFARIILDVLREPMLAMLIGAGLIYMALGDLQEALILVAFAGLSILITVVQETRTERALEALRDLTSPRLSSSAMGQGSASPGGRWRVAISWCWPKAIGCPPTDGSRKTTDCTSTNPC